MQAVHTEEKQSHLESMTEVLGLRCRRKSKFIPDVAICHNVSQGSSKGQTQDSQIHAEQTHRKQQSPHVPLTTNTQHLQ